MIKLAREIWQAWGWLSHQPPVFLLCLQIKGWGDWNPFSRSPGSWLEPECQGFKSSFAFHYLRALERLMPPPFADLWSVTAQHAMRTIAFPVLTIVLLWSRVTVNRSQCIDCDWQLRIVCFGGDVIPEVYSADWAVQNLEVHKSSLARETDVDTQIAECQDHQHWHLWKASPGPRIAQTFFPPSSDTLIFSYEYFSQLWIYSHTAVIHAPFSSVMLMHDWNASSCQYLVMSHSYQKVLAWVQPCFKFLMKGFHFGAQRGLWVRLSSWVRDLLEELFMSQTDRQTAGEFMPMWQSGAPSYRFQSKLGGSMPHGW